MGRQVALHMLVEDCEAFVSFLQERDPVIVVPYTSEFAELKEVPSPCRIGDFFGIWNRSLLPSLQYDFIPNSKQGPYYRIPCSAPVIELSLGIQVEWNSRAGLIQGRIYSSFECRDPEFARWYNVVVRWLRKKFVKKSGWVSRRLCRSRCGLHGLRALVPCYRYFSRL